MADDSTVTIEQVDGPWPEPGGDESRLIRTVYRLRKVPIRNLTAEDLRVLVAQQVSLQIVFPRALEELARNPLASGDFYPGDLLVATLRAARTALVAEDRLKLQEVVNRLRAEDAESAPSEVWKLASDL
ncbi:contact-dependent growth inhibition system immunity protein [Nocardia asteroides]|uniref:contact-dependent growth inhibition system immunity protein n=1 Tax=Nocardia asteroides TaxID=1824 RepID=UPI0036598A7C